MRGFGDLEAAVMDCLWEADEALAVRHVRKQLEPERSLAYTTVMTVLDNLHRKGWVRREMRGRAYVYEPVDSRAAYAARLMNEALEAGGDHATAFMHFVGEMSEEDTDALRKALRRVRRKK